MRFNSSAGRCCRLRKQPPQPSLVPGYNQLTHFACIAHDGCSALLKTSGHFKTSDISTALIGANKSRVFNSAIYVHQALQKDYLQDFLAHDGRIFRPLFIGAMPLNRDFFKGCALLCSTLSFFFLSPGSTPFQAGYAPRHDVLWHPLV